MLLAPKVLRDIAGPQVRSWGTGPLCPSGGPLVVVPMYLLVVLLQSQECTLYGV